MEALQRYFSEIDHANRASRLIHGWPLHGEWSTPTMIYMLDKSTACGHKHSVFNTPSLTRAQERMQECIDELTAELERAGWGVRWYRTDHGATVYWANSHIHFDIRAR